MPFWFSPITTWNQPMNRPITIRNPIANTTGPNHSLSQPHTPIIIVNSATEP